MNLMLVRVVVIGRTLTSAWIETNPIQGNVIFLASHSHECVD